MIFTNSSQVRSLGTNKNLSTILSILLIQTPIQAVQYFATKFQLQFTKKTGLKGSNCVYKVKKLFFKLYLMFFNKYL